MRTMVPLGWFVHVTPGTRQVTVGGAIAADVHGKSHHVDGSFSNHVESFVLHTPKGTVTVSPDSDPELFWGTAGALGLTGVIAEATIRLLPVETSMIRAENLRCPDLDTVMALMVEGDDQFRFSAAWIDCLATGASLGRSVLSRGDHATLDDLPKKLRARPAALRAQGPARRAAVGAERPAQPVERRRVQRVLVPRHPVAARARRVHLVVLPPARRRARTGTGSTAAAASCSTSTWCPTTRTPRCRQSIEMLSDSSAASFLAVLKRFGPGNPGPLSFPRPGWTLALDIPATVPGLGRAARPARPARRRRRRAHLPRQGLATAPRAPARDVPRARPLRRAARPRRPRRRPPVRPPAPPRPPLIHPPPTCSCVAAAR